MADHAESIPVLFATSEVAPWAKTGGLADVSASLPAALAGLGVDVRLAVPGYPSVLAAARSRRHLTDLDLLTDGETQARTEHRVRVLTGRLGRTPAYVIACPELFERSGGPYADAAGRDWPDNAERFATFSRAVARLGGEAIDRDFAPRIVHLNDWQTGLAAVYLRQRAERPGVVFAIHNLQYQGLFDRATFERLGLPEELWRFDRLEYHDQLSFLKGGLVFADRLITVSPTYAREIQTAAHGWGLDGLLRHRREALRGILNGIDDRVWHPARDPLIPASYSRDTLYNKPRNKIVLRKRLGLAAGRTPVLGVISRLAAQKGIDLILEIVEDILRLPAQLVVLGTGDPELEAALAAACRRAPSMCAFVNRHDERMAHLIEAGADIFLMPSRFEPCGLNQMYSLTYGTVPVVRRTGGLADTVVPLEGNAECGTGFVFEEPTPQALLATVRRAVDAYHRSDSWQALQRRGMAQDFSWRASAAQYLDLYRQLAG